MKHYILGHSPKLGSMLNELVWDCVRNDPILGEVPRRLSKKSVAFKDCWDFVLESLVLGEGYLESLGIDLEHIWENIDHEELHDCLAVGLVYKLEVVEHGYFSALLAEIPSNAVEFRCTEQDAYL